MSHGAKVRFHVTAVEHRCSTLPPYIYIYIYILPRQESEMTTKAIIPRRKGEENRTNKSLHASKRPRTAQRGLSVWREGVSETLLLRVPSIAPDGLLSSTSTSPASIAMQRNNKTMKFHRDRCESGYFISANWNFKPRLPSRLRSCTQNPSLWVPRASSIRESQKAQWGTKPSTSIHEFPWGKRPFGPPTSVV